MAKNEDKNYSDFTVVDNHLKAAEVLKKKADTSGKKVANDYSLSSKRMNAKLQKMYQNEGYNIKNYYTNNILSGDDDSADPYSNKSATTKSKALAITNGVYTNTLLEKIAANSNNQEWQASMLQYQEKMVNIMTSMSESLTAIAGTIVKKAGPSQDNDRDLSYQYKLSNMAKALAANDFGNASYEMSKMYLNKVDKMGILPLVNSFKDVIKDQLQDGGWKRLIKSTIQDSIFKLMPKNIQAQVSSWKDDPGMFYQNMLNAFAMNSNPAVRAIFKSFSATNSINLDAIKDKTNWKDMGQLTKKGQHVLEEIIPMHLASIDAALNKREVRVFDYDGDERWANISSLANRQAQEMERYNPKAMHKENFNLLMDAMSDIFQDLSRTEAAKYFDIENGEIARYADGTVKVKRDKEKLLQEVVKRMTMKYPGNGMRVLINDPDPMQVAKDLGFEVHEIPEAAMFIASWIRAKTMAINTGRDIDDLTFNLGTNLQDAMEDRDKIKTFNTFVDFFGATTNKRFEKLRDKAKFTTSTAEAAAFSSIMSQMFSLGGNADDSYINAQNVFINAANIYGGGTGSGGGGPVPPNFKVFRNFSDNIDARINSIRAHAEPEFRSMSKSEMSKYQSTRKMIDDIMAGKDVSANNVRSLDTKLFDSLDRYIPGMSPSEAQAYRNYKNIINDENSSITDYENAAKEVGIFKVRMETAITLFKALEQQGVTAEAMALKSKKPKEYYASRGYALEPQDLFVAIDNDGKVIEDRFRQFTHGGMTAEMADKLVADFKVLDGDLSFTKGGILKGGANVLSYMYNDPKLKKMLKFSTGAFGGALVGKMLADRGLIKNPAAGMIMGTALAGLNFLGIGNKFAQAMFGPTAQVKNESGVTDQDIAIAKLTQKFIPYAIGAAGGAKFGYNMLAGLTGSKALGALGGLAGGLVGLGVGKMTRSLVDRMANRDKDDQSKLAKFGRWLTGFKMFRGLRHVNGGGSDHMQYVMALKSIIINMQNELNGLDPKDKRYKILLDDILKLQDASEKIYDLERDYEKDVIGDTLYHAKFEQISGKVEGILKLHKKDKDLADEWEENIRRREAYQDTSRADMKYSFEEGDNDRTAFETILQNRNKQYAAIRGGSATDILKTSGELGLKMWRDDAIANLNRQFDKKDLDTQFSARKSAMADLKGKSFNDAYTTLVNSGDKYTRYLYGENLDRMSLDEIKQGVAQRLRINPSRLSGAKSIDQLNTLLGSNEYKDRVASMGYGTIRNKNDITNILARTKYGRGRDVMSTSDLYRDIRTYKDSMATFETYTDMNWGMGTLRYRQGMQASWDSMDRDKRLKAMLDELFRRATREGGFLRYARAITHVDNDFMDYMLTTDGLNPEAWNIDNTDVLFFINAINGEFQSRSGNSAAMADMHNFIHNLEKFLKKARVTDIADAQMFEDNLNNMLEEAIDAIKSAEDNKSEHITRLMTLENSSEFGATDSSELMSAISLLDGARGDARRNIIGLITTRALQMFSGEKGRDIMQEYAEAKSAMYGPSLIARHIFDYVQSIAGDDPELLRALTGDNRWGIIKKYLSPDASSAANDKFLSFKGLLGKISGTSIDDVYNLDESIRDNDKLIRALGMIADMPESEMAILEQNNRGEYYTPDAYRNMDRGQIRNMIRNIHTNMVNLQSDDDEFQEYLQNISSTGRGVKDRFFGSIARIRGAFQSKSDLTGKVKGQNASSIGCAMAAFNNAIKLLGYTPISDDTLNKVAEKHLENGGVEVGFFIEMCKKLKIRPRLFEGRDNTFNYSFFDKNRPSGKKAMVVLLHGEHGGHYVTISAMSKDMLTVIDNEEVSPKPRQVSISDVQANTSLVIILDDTANQKAIVESTRTRSFLSDPKGFLRDKVRSGLKSLFDKAKDKILGLKAPETAGTGLSPFTITNTTTANDSGIIAAIAASTERIVEAIGINAILSANSIKEGVNIANAFSNNGKYSTLKNNLTRALTKAATQEAMKEDAMVESAQLATAANTAALAQKLGAGQGVMPGQVSAEGGRLRGLGMGGLMLLGGAALVAGGAYLAKKGYDVFKSGISNLTGNVEERDAVVDEEGNYVQNASYSDTGTGFRQVRGGAAIMASGGMVMGKGGSLMAKGATKIAGALMAIPNKLISLATKGALGKALGMLGLKEKIVPFAAKLGKFIKSRLGNVTKKIADVAGKKASKGLLKGVPILSQIIIGIQAAASLYGGWKNAGKLVGVEQDELSIGQKTWIALIKMAYDTLPDLAISILTAAPGVGTGAAIASFAVLEIIRTFLFKFEDLLDLFNIRKSIREKVLADKAKRKQAEDMEDNAMRDANGNLDSEISGASAAALGITNEEFTTQLRNDGREDTSLGVTSSDYNKGYTGDPSKFKSTGNWIGDLTMLARGQANVQAGNLMNVFGFAATPGDWKPYPGKIEPYAGTVTDAVAVECNGWKQRIYTLKDGTKIIKEGGSLSWRNNNPGNLRHPSNRKNDWQLKFGKIGDDAAARGPSGTFAVFTSEAAGQKAKEYLIFHIYGNTLLSKMIEKYAPPNENNTANYINNVIKSVGGVNKPMNTYDEADRKKILAAMKRTEDWKVGKIYKVLPDGTTSTASNDALTGAQGNAPLNVTTPATSISNAQVGQADGLDQGGDYGGSQTANMAQYKNANITSYNPNSPISSSGQDFVSATSSDSAINNLTLAINTLINKINTSPTMPGSNTPTDITSLFNIMVEIRDAIVKGTAATVSSISSSNNALTTSIKDSIMIREQNTIATLN